MISVLKTQILKRRAAAEGARIQAEIQYVIFDKNMTITSCRNGGIYAKK